MNTRLKSSTRYEQARTFPRDHWEPEGPDWKAEALVIGIYTAVLGALFCVVMAWIEVSKPY